MYLNFTDVGHERGERATAAMTAEAMATPLVIAFGGVTDGIQVSHHLTRFSWFPHHLDLACHFGDTVGIIGDRAEGVHRNVVPGHTEHTDTNHCDSVKYIKWAGAVVK